MARVNCKPDDDIRAMRVRENGNPGALKLRSNKLGSSLASIDGDPL